MTGITANPGTTWVGAGTGTHMLLGDASKTYWNGTAWVAGQTATVAREGSKSK